MNKIDQLHNNIIELHGLHATKRITEVQFLEALRTLLTTYTCEVAKIDEGMFLIADREYSKADTILSNREKATLEIYNRLITEKYQAQTETTEPELRVGWEYKNGRGEWILIKSVDGHSTHPFNSHHGSFTTRGKWGLFSQSDNDLILSTGRPVQKQPSPNWWESLKEGDLVKTDSDKIFEITNWYQEQMGRKEVWIVSGKEEYSADKECTPYTPTPTEAIADLKNGKITEEQFQKVYKV